MNRICVEMDCRYFKVMWLAVWMTGLAALYGDEPGVGEAELPRIPATELAQSGETFSVEPGFVMPPAAGEPSIADPVAMSFDESGRLYVVEMRGYSERQTDHLGQIRLLEDLNSDGYFESAKIFADGLAWPTAVIAWNGGIFVAMTPNILWMKDTDSDGVADEKSIVFTGFGSDVERLNVQAMINSFRWGLDNRIHGATAGNGGVISQPNQPGIPPVNLRGRDFSFNPKSLDLRREGPTAQHGMCFDDWGRKYSCGNSDHIQAHMHMWHDLPARLSIAEDGPAAEVFRLSRDEPWRVVRTRWRLAGSVNGPIEGGGRVSGYFTSATGITLYRGDAFPEEFQGNAFIGDVGSNLIHRKMIHWNQGRLVARRSLNDSHREFIASTDNWFRPVQFENGPDGCLYVADMYREVIEHPWSIPQNIKNFLDLNSGHDRGRIYRIQPAYYKRQSIPNFKNLPVDQVVAFLGHPNAWHRESAAKTIAQSEPDQSSFIRSITTALFEYPLDPLTHEPLFVLQAAMALDGLSPLSRRQRLHCLDLCLNSNHPMAPEAIAAFLNYWTKPDAPIEESEKAGLVQSVFHAYQKNPGKPIPPQPIIPLLLGSTLCHPALRVEMFTRLVPANEYTITLAPYVVDGIAAEVAGQLLEEKVEDLEVSSASFFELLRELGHAAGRDMSAGGLTRELGRLKSGEPDGRVLSWTMGLIQAIRAQSGLTWRDVRVQKDVEELAGHMSGRFRSMPEAYQRMVLQWICATRHLASMDLIWRGLKESGEVSEDLIAMILSDRDLYTSREWSMRIIPELGQLSPANQVIATRTIAASPAGLELLKFLRDHPSQSLIRWIPANQVQAWRRTTHGEFISLVEHHFGPAPSSNRQSVIDQYIHCLTLEPDAGRGQVIFQNQCAQCHSRTASGAAVGPESQSFKSMSPEKLLVHILDPNREIAPEFIAWTITTQDENAYVGLLGSQTDSQLNLVMPGGLTESLLRERVATAAPTGRSLMPEGFESAIDEQGLADLIHFLKSSQ